MSEFLVSWGRSGRAVRMRRMTAYHSSQPNSAPGSVYRTVDMIDLCPRQFWINRISKPSLASLSSAVKDDPGVKSLE